ncbi:S8 family serine peptidase [Sporichthya polymorpha]|uniref:S8 family serine peptidase n=1 Tax=Sporichthya polymorpha TaxID=35751 RepID=UPI00035E601B|nr:S8 family serine peptidase [Sporichthya polymorpha]
MARRARRTGPRASVLVAGLSGIALVAAAVVAVAPSPDPERLPAGDYVLRAQSGELDDVLRDVRAAGGTVTGEFDSLDGAAVRLDADAATALAADGRVAALTPDVDVPAPAGATATPAPGTTTSPKNASKPPTASPTRKPTKSTGTKAKPKSTPAGPTHDGGAGQSYDAAADPNSLCNIAKLVGVRPMWRQGGTGQGVDVALIDSGVAPVPGLNAPGKVIHGPDLTPESQNSSTRYLDTFGHGTHMAGIIAGKDASVDTKKSGSCEGFAGMAPDARIISVKAADAHGATDVSQILAAIDWVVQHAKDPGMNIRVLNLSFGTDGTQDYVVDPLAHAVEVAWRKGIVVVVSAGNSGFADGRLTNPARNPHILAVGADDTKGTASTLDDTIPEFSSRGDSKRNPDIVAPGKSVQSLRVPGSYIDTAYGEKGAFAGRFFRGSGTSQAAAVASGAIAALISARPNLTPEQVKLLTATLGLGLVVADPRAQGHGLLQLGVPALVAALTSPPLVGNLIEPAAGLLNGLLNGRVTAPRAKGTGTLEGARGQDHLELDGKPLTGERDIFGKPFNSATHAKAAAAGHAWNGGTWNGSTWAGRTWAGRTWASTEWLGRTWAGRTWAGRTWADGSWNGRTWAGGTWNGRTWAGVSWAGRTWAGTDFAGGDWQ